MSAFFKLTCICMQSTTWHVEFPESEGRGAQTSHEGGGLRFQAENFAALRAWRVDLPPGGEVLATPSRLQLQVVNWEVWGAYSDILRFVQKQQTGQWLCMKKVCSIISEWLEIVSIRDYHPRVVLWGRRNLIGLRTFIALPARRRHTSQYYSNPSIWIPQLLSWL